MSTVECSYPIPEDASVGFLYIGANVMAIPMTFLGNSTAIIDTIVYRVDLVWTIYMLYNIDYLFV